MTAISNHSRSLTGLLTRTFSSELMPCFELAFALALQHGGLIELDYQRPEGQSFNPAPARIAQIAICDANVLNPNAIIVALLIFAQKSLTQETVAASFNSKVAEIYATCGKPLKHLLQEPFTDAKVIITCAWLDRLRHLHLAPAQIKSKLLEDAFAKTDEYIQLVHGNADSLVVLLEAWKTRASNRRNQS